MSAERDHADELLSAHLDGELDATTAAWVEVHLDACATCRQALADLAETRAMVRGLPSVPASVVVERFLDRHRSVVRLGAGFVALASVVLLALGLNAATHRPAVVPDLEDLAATHRHAAHHEMDGVRPAEGGTGYVAPAELIGSSAHLSRHAVYDGTDLTAVVYRNADVQVSVFEQPGRLDWTAMPSGEVAAVGRHEVWFGHGQPIVAVTELGDLVVTVVSDDRAAVVTAVAGLPEWRRRSAWDRVHDAAQRFTSAFALGG